MHCQEAAPMIRPGGWIIRGLLITFLPIEDLRRTAELWTTWVAQTLCSSRSTSQGRKAHNWHPLLPADLGGWHPPNGTDVAGGGGVAAGSLWIHQPATPHLDRLSWPPCHEQLGAHPQLNVASWWSSPASRGIAPGGLLAHNLKSC